MPDSELEKQAAAADLSGDIALMAMMVLVVVGIVLVSVAVGNLGFDPMAIAAISAAILIGVAFLAWHRHRMRIYGRLLRSIEAQRRASEGDPPAA